MKSGLEIRQNFIERMDSALSKKKCIIIGIGLPRTGTTSLSKSLDVLGYSGIHSCCIFGRTDNKVNSSLKYSIDNTSYKNIEEIISNNRNSKFILTTRADNLWKNSIKMFMLDSNIPNPSSFNRLVIDIFKKYNISLDNLFVIDFSKNKSCKNWDSICNFLDVKAPDVDFPFVRNIKA